MVCAHRENLPDLRAAALAALTGHVAAGETSADDTRDAPFELPKEWDDTLNTSGFWVLNVAPLPAPAEPEAVAEAPAAAAAHEPLARPLWRRLLGLPARDSARVEPGAVHSAVPEPGDDDPRARARRRRRDRRGPATAAASAPAGVLISADRYDLAELS